MKLFSKYNRINVTSTIIIFLLSCVAFFFLLQYVIISQVDEDLKIEKNEIITYADHNNRLPALIEVHDQYTTYQIIAEPRISINKIYTHKGFDEVENEKELQRTIQFAVQVNKTWYLVNVSKSLEGTEKLIKSIILIAATIILLILAVTFFINRIILKKLWQPFYNTLQSMQQFNLSNTQAVNFADTNIDEFKYLNSTLSDALSKAQHDYKLLKEFTENASHEVQTPLAVIQSKLDILIQNENLSEGESNAIQSAYKAVQNLSKLNQSLLLLAKIENKQFSTQTKINIKQLLQDKITQFNELWKSRNISLKTNLSNREIVGNTHLTEILLNNLLSNATKHNMRGGSIHILLNNDLQISNTGIKHSLDKSQLFRRFSRQSSTTGNHGLGSSIIYQICITSGYKCVYKFQSPNIHSFIINF